MNDGIFCRIYSGFRAIHWDVGGRIILVKPSARVRDVINNAGIIVLVLSDVKILHFRVGMSVDLSDGRLNNGLWPGCEDHYVAVRVGWAVVSGWRGHWYRSERDVGRVACGCVDVRQRRRRTIYVHDWHMLNERCRACACLYPGRLQWYA